MDSLKNIYRVTGAGYLIIFVTGFFSNFYVLEGLVVIGDPAATVLNINSNGLLFRLGIGGFLVMVLADLLLAWTLYSLFKSVNSNLSLLAAWFRLVNAAIFGLALHNLPDALQTAELIGASTGGSLDSLHSVLTLSINSFTSTWLIGLVFFGIHLLLLGYLIYKSDFAPRLIGIFLVIAGTGYLVDSFAHFLLADYESFKDFFMMIVLIPGIIGELSFTIWLLIKGFKFNSS